MHDDLGEAFVGGGCRERSPADTHLHSTFDFSPPRCDQLRYATNAQLRMAAAEHFRVQSGWYTGIHKFAKDLSPSHRLPSEPHASTLQ